MSSMRYAPIFVFPRALASLSPLLQSSIPWMMPEAQLPTPTIPARIFDKRIPKGRPET